MEYFTFYLAYNLIFTVFFIELAILFKIHIYSSLLGFQSVDIALSKSLYDIPGQPT